jgi:DNA-binding NarL/FixJ family response regulator
MLEDAITRYSPTVLLVDVEMPGRSGLSAISQIPDLPPTLIVTMHTADEYGTTAQEAGAKGFLSKGLPLPDLAAAIRAVSKGVDLFTADPEILESYRAPELTARAAAITERERDVLRCLVQGISGTEDIADELYISQKTVKNHLASIYEKLGVNDQRSNEAGSIASGERISSAKDPFSRGINAPCMKLRWTAFTRIARW